jgi:hypothetical protein
VRGAGIIQQGVVEDYLTYDGRPAQKFGNPTEFFVAKLKRE